MGCTRRSVATISFFSAMFAAGPRAGSGFPRTTVPLGLVPWFRGSLQERALLFVDALLVIQCTRHVEVGRPSQNHCANRGRTSSGQRTGYGERPRTQKNWISPSKRLAPNACTAALRQTARFQRLSYAKEPSTMRESRRAQIEASTPSDGKDGSGAFYVIVPLLDAIRRTVRRHHNQFADTVGSL